MNAENQKIKLLTVKLTSSRFELDTIKQMANTAAKEVDKMFFEKAKSTNEKMQFLKNENTAEEKINLERNDADNINQGTSNTKKAFRKIALKIHPDKLIGIEDQEELQEKAELYQKASRALENEDILILADILIDLGLQPPKISEQEFNKVVEEINSIKKKISDIESTYIWKWIFCSNKAEKKEILKKIFELMNDKYGTKNIRP